MGECGNQNDIPPSVESDVTGIISQTPEALTASSLERKHNTSPNQHVVSRFLTPRGDFCASRISRDAFSHLVHNSAYLTSHTLAIDLQQDMGRRIR